MVTPPNAPLQASIATLASAANIRALDTDGQLNLLVTLGEARSNGTLTSGKLLAILDENRKGGTLKGVVKKHLKAKGYDDDAIEDFAEGLGHSYKCATVFAAYVLAGLLPETDYDLGKVSWYVPVCAIENFWDKEKVPTEARATVRQRIVAILKAREAGTQTVLDKLWKGIRDADKEDEPGEPGEGSAGEGEPEVAAVNPLQAELDAARAEIAALKTELETVKAASSPDAMQALALACGEMLMVATEEQLNGFAPNLAGLPADLRELLMVIFAESVDRLALVAGPAFEAIRAHREALIAAEKLETNVPTPSGDAPAPVELEMAA